MKILFIADIHIKLGQKNVPIDWALNRYKIFIDKVEKLQKDVDLIILGGDIFDKQPNIQELSVYFDLISILNTRTIIYAGNHEAIKRNTTFFTDLKQVTNIVSSGYATVVDDYVTIAGIDIIPYNKLKEFAKGEKLPGFFEYRILATHVRGEIPPHVKPEIDLSLLDKWDLVLAGDLHSHSNSQRNIVYPGSPMTIGFHRNYVKNGCIIVDTDTLEYEFIEMGVPQLLRKTISVGEVPEASDYHHIIYEVEGNIAELKNMEDSPLIERKVARRGEKDNALLLKSNMSIEEELVEYLVFILGIEDYQEILAIFKELEVGLDA